MNLPVDVLNENLHRMGRSLDDATVTSHSWRGDEYGLEAVWADGFRAWIGFGQEASAMIESHGMEKH